ncbi:phospholipase A2 [Candidatus Poriferisodalis sp.]|uniref:phospholipase A2 n=1 Tax=Candidatus Poriferisodalis sp. TaxID=3101277 RepID=UPI003B028496
MISGIGAVPTLERTDSDGDGAEELGIEMSSLAGAAGAAVSSGTPGLSCPAGMVLDGNLCKTPVTESVEADRVCAQDGYVLVTETAEGLTSHSCQKTVPAHCTDGKILHEGQCQTRTVDQRDANWTCSEGTLETTFLDPGYAYSCKIAVSPPQCPDPQSYRTAPSVGCYEQVSFHETQDYTWACSAGTLVSTFLDPGYSHSCKIAHAKPQCPDGETYRNSRCETQEDYYRTRGYEWTCGVGTKVTTSGEHGTSYSCKIALSPPTCPDGETYRNSRCETQEDYYRTRGYEWRCSQGVRVVTSGEHGTAYSCRIALSPPTCPAGETYRNNRCEEQHTYYRTRGYEWKCSVGTRVTTSGEHGTSYSCRIALSPPTCPNGETYRNNRCETQQTYYDSRPYRYTCPSGYTLKTTTIPPTCTKTETYRKKVCSYDPIAGQQCWWENRTRTLTKPAAQTCPSGYSPDGTGCTADRASKRWVKTASAPTRHRYVPAVRSCIADYSPAGSLCRADKASTRWVKTASAPTRHRYVPAAKSCISGYSDNGVQCRADKASTRWVKTASTPAKFRYVPAAKSCLSGYSDNGVQCRADKASTRWVETGSAPAKFRYVPAVKSCPAGWSDSGARCESDTASARWDRTSSVPVTSRTAAAVRSCDAGFAWNAAAGKCDKTTYSDPTGPLTRLVGDPPQVSCRDGYSPAGGGRCTRTTLGEPTAVPTGAGCISDLGTLAAGSISRSGTLGAGCTSLRRGDAQSPHWARRFSLRVAAASTATFTVSSSSADVFVYVLSGSGTAVVEVASDDDSGAGTDAKVADVALAAGVTYTVEVTTPTANIAGAFALTAAIAAVEAPVAISGLADTTRSGAGTVAVAAAFAVEPAAAVCTATADAAGVAPKVAVGPAAHQRTVTVTAAAPFSHTVTVTCDAPGRTATKAAVTLAAVAQQVRISGLDDSVPSRATTTGGVAYAVDVFTVEPASARCTGTANGRGAAAPQVSSRGGTGTVVVRLSPAGAATVTVTCTAPGHSPGVARALFSYSPRPRIANVTAAFAPNSACTTTAPDRHDTTDTDADAVHWCTLARGAALVATLTAVADHATIAAAWDTDSAVTATPAPAAAATPVIGPDNTATGDWHTTATATLRCTTDGAATATLTAGVRPAVGTHTTAVHIDCQAPVRIDGLDDAAGYGKTGAAVTVAEEFTVTPADAQCTAAPAGTVTAPDPALPQHRLLSAEVTAGATVTVTVACTADGYADSSQDVELAVEEATLSVVVSAKTCAEVSPAPADADAGYRCVLSDGHRLTLTATADASVRDVSIGWSAAAGATLSRRVTNAIAAVAAPGGELTGTWRRVGTAAVECSSDAEVTLTVTLGSGAAVVTRTTVVAVDCEQQGSISGFEDAAAAGTATVTAADGFTVKPASAKCTAEPASAKVTAGIGGSRTVSLGLSAVPGEDVSEAVRVDCTPPGHAPVTATATFTAAYADSCDDPLGALADGLTARSGTVARNTACISPQRVRDGGSAKRYWARRHTFTLGLPAVLRVDAASPTRNGLDAYVLVLEGHAQDGTGTVLGRDDNSGLRSGARVAGLRLEPGDYTIEVTTAKRRHTGDYRLRVQARLGVLIDDLHGSSRIGTGTAVDHFTVLPPDAACTPDTGTVTDLGDGQRALTADLAAVGSTTITVTCRRAGYRTAAATATLTALDPIDDVAVKAASGGTCTEHHGTLDDGVDSEYMCTMTRGETMTLQADATSPSTRTVLGWAAAGVRAVPDLGDLDASVVGDTVTFTRTGTATVTCTDHGRITITARIGVAVHHTTEVAVTCQPPVQITNYTPGIRNGPGPVTGTYNVTPPSAHCTARNAGGITGTPTPGGTGTARTVTVTTTATGTLDIEIECEADHHTTTTATAQFRADDQAACSTALGVLWHGSIARTGTLSTASCVSDKRTPSSGTFHADRYTFTMATAGWVTIDMEGTGTGADKLDTYLVVLYGHGSGGVERIRDDDSGGDGDARVSDVLLAAGRYTIEATTASNTAQGAYRLRVQGDFAVRAPDQPVRPLVIDARVGQPITRTWAHQPATAAVTVQSVSPEGLDASIVSDDGQATLTASPALAGEYTVTVAYTASGHTSTQTTIIDADCPPRHIETKTRTCIPIATALPTGCTPTALHDGRIWGRKLWGTTFGSYSSSALEQCMSLSQDGRALYHSFSIPRRLPVSFRLDALKPDDPPNHLAPLGGTAYLHEGGGAPSMTLWLQMGAGDASSLRFKATSRSTSSRTPLLEQTLGAGDYILELAPSSTVAAHGQLQLRTTMPTAERQHEEVQRFGHTGDVPNQLTLAEFVATRADEHLSYPYLTWTSDDCTAVRDEWVYWREATPADYAANQNTGRWVSITLPVYWACWRHDFNWRNLARIEHFVDLLVDSWNKQARDDSDDQFELDLRVICDEFLQTSLWYNAKRKCYSNAWAYRFGVANLAWVTPSPDIGPPERIE